MRTIGMVISLWLVVLPASGQENPAKPDTPEQAAEKVRTAFAAGSLDAVKDLAGRSDPDPWLVADELIRREDFDAADAFARAAPGKDHEGLPAWVEAERERTMAAESRRALAEGRSAFREGKLEEALGILTDAKPSGKGVVSVQIASTRASVLYRLRRLPEAMAAYEEASRIAESLGWLRRAAITVEWAGIAASKHADFARSIAFSERYLELMRRRGTDRGLAVILGNIGMAHGRLGNREKAVEYPERALRICRDTKDRAQESKTLIDLAAVQQESGAVAESIRMLDQAIAIAREVGDPYLLGLALTMIGSARIRKGDQLGALPSLQLARQLFEKRGDRRNTALVLINIGVVHSNLGDYPKARSHHSAALEIGRKEGDRRIIAAALANLGGVLMNLGEYPRALERLGQSLALTLEIKDIHQEADIRESMGRVLRLIGDYAGALGCLDEAMELRKRYGSPTDVARVLFLASQVHLFTGRHRDGLELLSKARRLIEGEVHEDSLGLLALIGDMGSHHQALGETDEAEARYREALEIARAGDLTLQESEMLANLGRLAFDRDELETSVKYFEQALPLAESVGDRLGVVVTLDCLGVSLLEMGESEEAMRRFRDALVKAEEMRAAHPIVVIQGSVARCLYRQGRYEEAVRVLRSCVERIPGLTRGLAQTHGALARGQFSGIFDTGVQAALASADLEAAVYFLESGRAGALRESLRARDTLYTTVIPEKLRKIEADARAKEAVALARLRAAEGTGKMSEIRRGEEELKGAQVELLKAIDRIQREARRGADLVYPRPDSVADMEALLGEGEALVLYGLLDPRAVAIVISPEKTRTVRLEKSEVITAAIESTDLMDLAVDPAPALARLRSLLVDPLGLNPDVKRLIVSPDGAVAQVPLSLLTGGREVAYVPSGTTYGVLAAERALRGEDVLAVGEPHYGTPTGPVAVLRRGANRAPLPATGEEAKAVGDVVLLGEDASETMFARTLGERDRWRAVHLACHCLIDPERVSMSSLVLTADEENDGFITVLDVFRLRIPADLAVLSACETGKGRAVRGEGLIGLTRAFMYAGAPRVICSLWKVDDEATKALMVKFYEIWNPKEGEGLPAATALKQAQEFVKSHEKWQHPYYWAGWVLWGLPD